MKAFLIQLLCLILIFFPKIDVIKISESGIRIEDILTLVVLLLLLPNLKNILENEKMRKITGVFGIYILFCFLSALLGWNYGYVNLITSALFVFRKIEYFVFIYFGYQYYKNRKEKSGNLDKFVNIITFFHLGICLLQLFGVMGSFNAGGYLTTLHQGRITSIFNGSYEFSAFMLIITAYYISNLSFKGFKNINKLNVVGLVIASILIFLSNSRISVVILLLECLLGIIRKIHITFNKKTILLIGGFFGVILIGFTLIWNSGILENTRFAEISLNGYIESMKCAMENRDFDRYVNTGNWFTSDICYDVGTDASFNLRFNHWAQLLDGFFRHPVFGLGPSITTEAADGNYIRILVESGLVGMTLWILLLIQIFKSLMKKDWINYFAKISFYSILIGAIFIDLFEASRIMPVFWLIVGWVISYNEKNKKCDYSK